MRKPESRPRAFCAACEGDGAVMDWDRRELVTCHACGGHTLTRREAEEQAQAKIDGDAAGCLVAAIGLGLVLVFALVLQALAWAGVIRWLP